MITLTATGKTVDTSPLQGRLTQGERNVDAVKIVLPRRYGTLDLTALVFTLYAWTQTGAGAEYSMLPTATEDTVEVIWLVTDAFTAEAGPLELELRGYSSEVALQPVIIFQMGTVTEKPSVANKLRAASAADQVILDEARKAAAQSAQSAAASDAALEKAKQVGNRVNVYSTVEELTAAEKNPWHGAMAGAGDHFYYYNGTQWVQGAPMGMDARNKAAGNPATGAALNAEKVLGTDKIMTLDGTGYTDIPMGADLNDAKYRVHGQYRCTGNNIAKTLKNSPFPYAFIMEVIAATGEMASYPMQIATEHSVGTKRCRTWYGTENRWIADWRETAQTETTELALLNGWESDTWVANKGVTLSRSGNICALALYVKNPVTTGNASVIAMVPADYRPKTNREFICHTLSQTVMRISIHKSGEIYQYGALPANTIIALTDAYPIGG